MSNNPNEPISRGQGQTIIDLIRQQNAKLDGIKGDVSELKDDVSELKEDVAELKDDVSEIKSVYNLPNNPSNPRKRR